MEKFMDLKDFIEHSLLQICDGVKEAKDKSNTLIAPKTLWIEGMGSDYRKEQMVEFDIAVTTFEMSKKDEGGKAGIGIGVAKASIGTQTDKEKSHESISRIKFAVPVFLQGEKSNNK
jgi:hypothetical protein